MENCNTVTIVSLKTADAVIKADRNVYLLGFRSVSLNPESAD